MNNFKKYAILCLMVCGLSPYTHGVDMTSKMHDIMIYVGNKRGPETIKAIIDANKQDGYASLFYLCSICNTHKSQHKDLFDTIITHCLPHVDVRMTDHGITPLTVMCRKGCIDSVKYLVEKGADIHQSAVEIPEQTFMPTLFGDNSTNGYVSDGYLHIACTHGHTDVAKFLIEKGLDVNMRDNKQQTALHKACEYKQNIDTARFLINKDVNINVKDNDGFTALHLACMNGYTALAKILIDNGADVNIESNSTPKSLLSKEIIYLLINSGVHFSDDEKENMEMTRPFIIEILNIEDKSISYQELCKKISDKNDHSFYFSRLCAKGKFEQLMNMLKEKNDGINKDLFEDIIISLGSSYIITRTQTEAFFNYLQTYISDKINDSAFKKEWTQALIGNVDLIKDDDIIIQAITHLDLNINEKYNGISLIEKSIIDNRKNIFDYIIQQSNVDIDKAYMLYKKCQDKSMTAHDAYGEYRHFFPEANSQSWTNDCYKFLNYAYDYVSTSQNWEPEQKKSYARALFNIHNYKRLLTGTYKPQKENGKTFYINPDIVSHITSYTDSSQPLPESTSDTKDI
jgi:ankyrin repeat protein